MNFSEVVLSGMLLACGVGLLSASFIVFFRKNYIELGLIAFILGTGTVANLIQAISFKSLYSHPFIDFLISDFRQVLIIPLLYIYIHHKLNFTNHKQIFIRHITFPLLLFIVYIAFKYTQTDNIYDLLDNNTTFVLTRLLPLGLFIFYYVKGVSLLKKYKATILNSVYKRYSLFYHLICIRLISSVLFLTLTHFKLLKQPLKSYAFHGMEFYRFLIIAVTLFFVVFELDYLKQFFHKKNISYNTLGSEKIEQLENFIYKLKSDELFTNENFILKDALKSSDISEKEFNFFITINYNLSVNDYLNNLYLNKFIELVKQENTEKYDISGLSRLAGFKSRATFYRVFKEQLGMTPKQYMRTSR